MTDDDHPDEAAHTDPLEQAQAPQQADDQVITTEPEAHPPRRRWLSVRHASHQHPVALPIGAGSAGLLLGAGVTAALFTAYAPVEQMPAALHAMPPARINHAPPPQIWPGPLPPRGAHPLDDPPPPPPPGWGPPPPPFGGPPPPPPGWGPPPPPPPPGPWGPPPPP
jgi:hypothetical protein